MTCEQGVPPCGAAEDVHPYLTGLCCPKCTPAAVAGRREAWGQDEPLPGSRSFIRETAIDQQHRASGKRANKQQRSR